MTVIVGVLGFAHAHVHNYSRMWRAHPDMEVVVRDGWDHDAVRLAQATATFGLNGAESPEALLARPGLQAVLIGSETALHAELVEKAARAGKAVILQKPIALTMREADRIVTAVRDAGIPFTLAWQMRVDPQNLKMRELLNAGTLGRVFMLRRRHGLPLCLDPKFASSWHVSPRWNRDIWADDASHPVDFIYWLFGRPESVTAEIVSLNHPAMPMDNGVAIFRYPNGPLAEIDCSFTCRAGENTTEIIGDRGTLVQNYGDVPSCNVPRAGDACGLKWYLAETKSWIRSDIPTPASHAERIDGLAAPLAEFLHGARPPIATAEEGRDVLRMVLAGHVSARDGRRTRLDDADIDTF